MGTGLHADRLPQGRVAPALSPRSLDASDAAQEAASVVHALWVVSCLAVLVGIGLDLPKAFAQGNRVYVDQAYAGAIEDGSAAHPFREFTAGARNVARGGTVFIAPGQYAAVGTYATPMTL